MTLTAIQRFFYFLLKPLWSAVTRFCEWHSADVTGWPVMYWTAQDAIMGCYKAALRGKGSHGNEGKFGLAVAVRVPSSPPWQADRVDVAWVCFVVHSGGVRTAFNSRACLLKGMYSMKLSWWMYREFMYWSSIGERPWRELNLALVYTSRNHTRTTWWVRDVQYVISLWTWWVRKVVWDWNVKHHTKARLDETKLCVTWLKNK